MADWMGTSGGYGQQTIQNPQQQQLMSQLLSGLGGAQESGMEWLQKMLSGDEGAFSDYEAPFMRQFEQETMPGIAERFAGMGSGGSQNSSAMQQTMAQAGGELSQNLASLRGGLQQNAMGLLQGMMGQGYQPTFENTYQQPTTGIIPGMIQGAGQGVSSYAGMKGMKEMGIF
jgi:hypothetical protein